MSERELPPGYIANGNTYALDSWYLARDGAVHSRYTNQPGDPMDSFVEFSIEGDTRLEWMRKEAVKIGRKYNDPESEHYIKDVQKREKAITDELMPLVANEYGSYSDETVQNGANAGERKSHGFFSDDTVYLKDMEKGSLVCRHYAPIISVLLNDAGVPNDLVSSSDMQGLKMNSRGDLELVSDEELQRHMYVVTREGNAIVEATTAAEYSGGRNDGTAYMPIKNGVTTEQIVYSGQVAVTDHLVYGGHSGDGETSRKWVAASREGALERYNDQRQQELAVLREEQAKRAEETRQQWERERQERREQAHERREQMHERREQRREREHGNDHGRDDDEQRRTRQRQGEREAERPRMRQRGERGERGERDGLDERAAKLREETHDFIEARQEYANARPRQREARGEAVKEAQKDFLKAVVDLDGDGKFTDKDMAKLDRNQDGKLDQREFEQIRRGMTTQSKDVADKVLRAEARKAGVDDFETTDKLIKTLDNAGVKLEKAPADNELTAAGVKTDEKATNPLDDKMRMALAQFNDPNAKQEAGSSIPGQLREQFKGRMA